MKDTVATNCIVCLFVFNANIGRDEEEGRSIGFCHARNGVTGSSQTFQKIPFSNNVYYEPFLTKCVVSIVLSIDYIPNILISLSESS